MIFMIVANWSNSIKNYLGFISKLHKTIWFWTFWKRQINMFQMHFYKHLQTSHEWPQNIPTDSVSQNARNVWRFHFNQICNNMNNRNHTRDCILNHFMNHWNIFLQTSRKTILFRNNGNFKLICFKDYFFICENIYKRPSTFNSNQ